MKLKYNILEYYFYQKVFPQSKLEKPLYFHTEGRVIDGIFKGMPFETP